MSGEGLIPDDRLRDLAVAPGEDGDHKPQINQEREDEKIEAERRRRDELENAPISDRNLDAGLEDSMDGSDPPSSTQP